MDKKIKFIRNTGIFNHFHVLLICLLSFPFLIVTIVIFADQINAIMERWIFQFIFAMSLFLAIGLTWAIRKILGK